MELKLRLTRKRVAIVVVLAALLAAGAGYAAIPDGSGVYTACMLNKIGTIRIIDPASQKCSASLETQITFGAKGEKGEQGLQGLKGDKGDQGIQGLKGDDGSQGLQGLKGDKGDKGDQGDQGDHGIQGLK